MLEFNYYEELKKYSVDTERLRQFINETDAPLSKLFCDVLMPFARVLFYASLHDKDLYRKVMGKISQLQYPFFHKRLEYEKLFPSLRLFGDDCLQDLLSKLDCSDSEFNALQLSIKNKDYAQFKNVLDGSKINTTSITPEYRFAYISVFLDDFMQIIVDTENRINAIQDEEQRKIESKNAVISVIGYLNSFWLEFTDDDKFKSQQAKHFNDWINGKIGHDDDNPFEYGMYSRFMSLAAIYIPSINQDTFTRADVKSLLYRGLLLFYYIIVSKYQACFNSFTLKVLKDIVLNADYEDIWRLYDETEEKMSKLYFDIWTVVGMNPVEVLTKMEDGDINKTTTNTIEIPAKTAIDTSEVDRQLSVIKDIIGMIDDKIKTPQYSSDYLEDFFTRLLKSEPLNEKQSKVRAELIDDLGRTDLMYTYGSLSLMYMFQILGYIMTKNRVFKDKVTATKLARQIVESMGDDLTVQDKDKDKKDCVEGLRGYIQDGADARDRKPKQYERWDLLDHVLDSQK